MGTGRDLVLPAVLQPPILQLHTQAIRQPVDEGVVAGYEVDVEDSPVVEARVTKAPDIVLSHSCWIERELQRVVQHRTVCRFEIDPPIVLNQLIDPGSTLGQPTQTRCVVVDSVVALVGRRDRYSEHLPPDSG